jgi:uncharacterized protein YbbK (DUF523 family)
VNGVCYVHKFVCMVGLGRCIGGVAMRYRGSSKSDVHSRVDVRRKHTCLFH